jgi:hypothetical protein
MARAAAARAERMAAWGRFAMIPRRTTRMAMRAEKEPTEKKIMRRMNWFSMPFSEQKRPHGTPL